MARLASIAIGGYYPTPTRLIPAIAALVDATAARQARYDPRLRASVYPTYGLLDPCAGDGAALVACAQALFGDPLPAVGQGPRLRLYACELEATRAAALRARCQAAGLRAGDITALAADAFQLTWTTDDAAAGVDLLWLNPPYDRAPRHAA